MTFLFVPESIMNNNNQNIVSLKKILVQSVDKLAAF
jgi:hypothetical protein